MTHQAVQYIKRYEEECNNYATSPAKEKVVSHDIQVWSVDVASHVYVLVMAPSDTYPNQLVQTTH